MFVIENLACPRCEGKGKIKLKARHFAICTACEGKGSVQQYKKLRTADLLRIAWQKDSTEKATEWRKAANDG